jgi:hypothetical protein
VNRTEVKLDGIWGDSVSYPGKTSCSALACSWLERKTKSRKGNPEARREQRLADLWIVLKTQGRRSLVTEWRRKP